MKNSKFKIQNCLGIIAIGACCSPVFSQSDEFPFMELNIPNYQSELANKNAAFVKNKGQLGIFGQPGVAANQVVYYSNQPDFYDFVLRDRLSFVSAQSADTMGHLFNVNRLDLLFFNSETDEFLTLEPVPYQIGHAKRHFYTGLSNVGIENVPEYSELYFKSLYQGISMSLSHNRMGLRAHFRVTAGFDPLTIKMKLDGLTSVNFAGGNLNIGAHQSNYQFHKPVAYQIDANDNINYVPVTWGIDINGHIYLNTGDYDPNRDLFFAVKQGDDPILTKDSGDNLEWSSYIGEAGGTTLHSVITDTEGNVMYSGKASDVEFAANIGFMPNVPYSDGGDAFLIKFNENIEPQWYTFFGGNLSTAANVNATVELNRF